MMAAQDNFELRIKGKGSHAAMPHQGIDPLTVASQLQTAWQLIVTRFVDPADAAVISVTQIHAGDTWNVIPETVILRGTVRTMRPQVQDRIQAEMTRRANLVAETFGATAELDYQRLYPATINTPAEAALALDAARSVVGEDGVDTEFNPSMGAEDFAFMLQKKPGAYAWLGSGGAEDGRNLHSARFDFNDAVLATGVQYWTDVVSRIAAR